VNRLEREGLSRKQSVGIMEALEEVVEESIRTMTANLVTRAEQEKHQYTQKVDFAKLKSEITLLEKQDFSLLKSENERLLSEVERLKQRLREGASASRPCSANHICVRRPSSIVLPLRTPLSTEITRTQAGVRLDLNLEKGRIRDELSAREVKIKEVDTRIESEISTIRAQMESVKVSQARFVPYAVVQVRPSVCLSPVLSCFATLSVCPAHLQFGILQYVVGSTTGLFALLLGQWLTRSGSHASVALRLTCLASLPLPSCAQHISVSCHEHLVRFRPVRLSIRSFIRLPLASFRFSAPHSASPLALSALSL
jgi:hypothetical protein